MATVERHRKHGCFFCPGMLHCEVPTSYVAFPGRNLYSYRDRVLLHTSLIWLKQIHNAACAMIELLLLFCRSLCIAWSCSPLGVYIMRNPSFGSNDPGPLQRTISTLQHCKDCKLPLAPVQNLVVALNLISAGFQRPAGHGAAGSSYTRTFS